MTPLISIIPTNNIMCDSGVRDYSGVDSESAICSRLPSDFAVYYKATFIQS